VESAFDEELQKIREKTFNSELKDLVHKVTGHSPDDVDSIESPRQMLKRLHALYYRAVNMLEMHGPVEFPNEEILDAIDRDMDPVTLLHNRLEQLKFDQFALLSYNIANQCFKPVSKTSSSFTSENLLVDVSEKLYRDIRKNRHGVLLDHEEILNNTFLKKRFMDDDEHHERNIYFVSLGNIVDNFFMDADHLYDSRIFKSRFSSILVLRIPPDYSFTAEELYRLLSDTLIYELVLVELEYERNNPSKMFILERPLENLYRIYEYFFLLSRYQDSGKVYLMHSVVAFTEEMVYLWHYITFKLQCQLSPASMILRHEKDIILLFADTSDVDIVESFFTTIQNIFPGMITFDSYDNKEFSHSMGLLRKIEKL